MGPPASVIVRARDEVRTIRRTLESLREQTVVPEIILVDSGSQDGTLEVAAPLCDRVITIPPESFSYGRGLNVGAAAAGAPFHFALSAHCFLRRPDWIERSLFHYQRDDVAGTNGVQGLPGRGEVFYQYAGHARANPFFGFTNHASSWRARVWEEFPFDETLEYAEDKEWALRVLEAGWVIVFDPLLDVDMSHVWRAGLADFHRRQRTAARAISSFNPVSRYRLLDLLREWWGGDPDGRAPWRRRASAIRAAGLIGKYQGVRDGRTATRSRVPSER